MINVFESCEKWLVVGKIVYNSCGIFGDEFGCIGGRVVLCEKVEGELWFFIIEKGGYDLIILFFSGIDYENGCGCYINWECSESVLNVIIMCWNKIERFMSEGIIYIFVERW